MRKAFASLLVSLAVAATAYSDHKILGDRDVPAHSFTELSVADSKGVVWFVAPSPVKQVTRDGTLFLAGVPGKSYQVTALVVVVDFDARTFNVDSATATIRFGVQPGPQPPDPGPAPPNPPDPPDPKPAPSGKLVVVLVEETREAVARRGVFFADRDLDAFMKAKGHRWRAVDKDVIGADGKPPTDVKRFLDDAKTKALPQLYLVASNGKTVFSGDMPAKPADLLALLKKHGGE